MVCPKSSRGGTLAERLPARAQADVGQVKRGINVQSIQEIRKTGCTALPQICTMHLKGEADQHKNKLCTTSCVFVLHLLSDSSAHPPPRQVTTAARLINFNPTVAGWLPHKGHDNSPIILFRGGGVTNLFVQTPKPAPLTRVS